MADSYNNMGLPQDAFLRNLKDFMEQYNTATELCFNKCITNYNKRSLSSEEPVCVRSCSLKTIKSSQRNMQTFNDVLPRIMERVQKEAEDKAREVEAKQFEEFVKQQKLQEEALAKAKAE